MPKLDANIYGADSVAMANEVSSAALAAEKLGTNAADYWNNTVQDTRAQSEPNVGRESLGPSSPATPVIRIKSEDLEKLSKVRTGKTTEAHGTGQKQTPKHDRAPGKTSGPVYNNKES